MASDKSMQKKAFTQTGIQINAFFVSVFICILFSVCFSVSNAGVTVQGCEVELDSRINPNKAPISSLVRLPRVGCVLASAIVAYREKFERENADKAAFEKVQDLQNVKGIGSKTAGNISQWLKFE